MEQKQHPTSQPTTQGQGTYQQLQQIATFHDGIDKLIAQAQQQNNPTLQQSLQQMRNDPIALQLALQMANVQRPTNYANVSTTNNTTVSTTNPNVQQDQWHPGVILQSLMTPQQQQMVQQQQARKAEQEKMDYNYYTNLTWKLVQDGLHIGDINFKKHKLARLYPYSAGCYFEPDNPIQISELPPFVQHVKEVIATQMLELSNAQSLTEAMQASINQITVNNIVGFLLRDSISNLTPLAMESQPWLYLNTTVSYKCCTNYAFWSSYSYNNYAANTWCSTNGKFPSIMPDSPRIREMIKRLTNVKVAGWILHDKSTNKTHFIKMDTYRRFFTSHEWNLKTENKCFYHWNDKQKKLIQAKQGRKQQYLFFTPPTVECLL